MLEYVRSPLQAEQNPWPLMMTFLAWNGPGDAASALHQPHVTGTDVIDAPSPLA